VASTVIAEDLLAFLLAQATITALTTRVHWNHVPEEPTDLYMWFARAGTDQDRTLDQAQGELPRSVSFDVECIGTDPSNVVDLAEAVQGLDCAKGTFGSGTCQLVLIGDESDEYVPRGVYSDEGLHVQVLRLEVIGYAPGTRSSSSPAPTSSSSSSSSSSPESSSPSSVAPDEYPVI